MTPTTTALVVFLMTWLAALRLTRLAISDTISKPFRDALASREARSAGVPKGQQGPGPKCSHRYWSLLSQLFDCPWCIGFWISAAAAAAELHVANPAPGATLWWSYPALTLSLSWLVGFGYTAMYTLEIYEPPQGTHEH